MTDLRRCELLQYHLNMPLGGSLLLAHHLLSALSHLAGEKW